MAKDYVPDGERFCTETRKRKYKTRKQAKTQLAIFIKLGGSSKKVYKCPHCKTYHLTSQT